MQRLTMEGVVYRYLTGAEQLKAVINLVSRRADQSVVVRNFIDLTNRIKLPFQNTPMLGTQPV